MKVKICERLQPLTVILPAEQLTGTEPQLFEAVTAPPKLPLAMPVQEGRLPGLQPRFMVLSQFVNDGVGVVVGETVKLAWQKVVNGAQLLLYVNVTVVVPPQASGAPALLLVSIPLHPPDAEAVANHVVNAASTAVCV